MRPHVWFRLPCWLVKAGGNPNQEPHFKSSNSTKTSSPRRNPSPGDLPPNASVRTREDEPEERVLV